MWNSSLSEENIADLRRVQRAAVRINMGQDYIDYTNALSVHTQKNCTKKKYDIFPLRIESRLQTRRHTEKYMVQSANTERLRKSSLPQIQKILNAHDIQFKSG